MHVSGLRPGFTLVELMVTLAVAAVVLLIGVPSYQSVVLNNRIAQTANDFSAFLMTTQSEAVKRRRSVGITSEGGADGWCVGARAVVDNDDVARFGGCPGGLALETSANVGALAFSSRGFLDPVPGGTFTVAASAGGEPLRCYVLNAVGQLGRTDCE